VKNDTNKTELTIAKLLTVGVLTSAAVILLGLVLYLITGNGGYDGGFPMDPLVILRGLLTLKPYAIILTGLFILILTPIFRVCVSILVFIKEKDMLYVAITSFVFLVLLVSLFLGKAE
jgi:uncharacterized membrane protein